MAGPVSTHRVLATILVLHTVCSLLQLVGADINSGCPTWGCRPWGSFALSSGLPVSQPEVKWSVQVDQLKQEDGPSYRGCVSDQQVVVCPTQRGYISLDPTTGQQLWNYSTKTSPFLPIADIYGDVLGLDTENLYYVRSDGTPLRPLSLGDCQPRFSAVLANNSLVLLTTSNPSSNQILTFETNGVISASLSLKGNVERFHGTFIPSSHPIIAGFRAYVMTEFMADDQSSESARGVDGLQRLYAIDLRNRMDQRLEIAWYLNLERESRKNQSRNATQNETKGSKSRESADGFRFLYDSTISPIITYFRGRIYINNVGPESRTPVRRHGDREQNGPETWKYDMPLQSTLWAIQDNGTDAALLYREPCWYGPMAIYDEDIVNSEPMEERVEKDKNDGDIHSHNTSVDDHVLWVLNRSPGMVAGYSTANGSTVAVLDISRVPGMRTGVWLPSRLSVTRQTVAPTVDVLVMGAVDANMDAFLVAVEARLDSERLPRDAPRLLWSSKLSGKSDNNTFWTVDGQIVNYVQRVPNSKGDSHWMIGLVATVVEHGLGYSKVYVKGVY